MEKYKANQNGEYKTSNERAVDNNIDNFRNLAEVAKKTPHSYVKAAGHVVSSLDKMTGGRSTEDLSKVATRGIQNSPGGKITQAMLNKVNESGLGNTIGKFASNKGQDSKNKSSHNIINNTKHNKNSNFGLSNIFGLKNKKNNNNLLSGDGDFAKKLWNKIPTGWKIKIVIGGGVFLLLLLMVYTVFAQDDVQNLSLTNGTSISGSSIGSRKCSAEEIENKLLYVGDSRTVGMQSSLSNQNISYIAEVGKGYDWFNNTALVSIENNLQQKSDIVVVLGLGVNDLHKIDNYITAYKSLIAKYPNNNFYVLSVNPVDESKTGANGYTVTNADIENFNKKLASNFPNNYIDSYSSLTSIGTSDGLHYDSDTYKSLNSIVTSNISSSGKVMCGASGNLASSLEDVANWYIQNVSKYDQSLYVQSPFTTSKVRADCSGFAVAYMSYVAGTDIPISYSGEMIYPNGQWAQNISQYGWKAYSSDEVGTLQTGDVLISQAGVLYSTKGKHAEIYVDEFSTFGWGSVKTQYPTSNAIQTINSGGHVHFMDSTHDYITIYRYEG